MAGIWHCYGSGVGQQQQLRLDLAWESPYAAGVALKRQKDQKKKKKKGYFQHVTLELLPLSLCSGQVSASGSGLGLGLGVPLIRMLILQEAKYFKTFS